MVVQSRDLLSDDSDVGHARDRSHGEVVLFKEVFLQDHPCPCTLLKHTGLTILCFGGSYRVNVQTDTAFLSEDSWPWVREAKFRIIS